MFFILPIGVDYRARRYPVVTFTIMGICTVVYLVTLFCTLSGDEQAVDHWVHHNLWLIPNDAHWWNYVTHIFVHGGILHLVGNMVYLFLFGSCVEDIIGRVRYTIFYLISGIAAAYVYIAVSPEHFASAIPMGGASGAISGCMGCFLPLMWRSEIEFKWVLLFFLRIWQGEFALPAWLVISFWFLKDFAMMFAAAAAAGPQTGGVAFGAHVGGMLFGVAWGVFEWQAGKRRGPEEDEDEEFKPAIQRVRPMVRTLPILAPALAPGEVPTIYLYWADTDSQIQRMFAAGQIPAEAVYALEGMTEWRSADELRMPGTV